MKKSLNTVFLIIATLVVGGGLYWFFFMGGDPSAPLSANVVQNRAQAQFETLTGQLDPISFDLTIFSDPRFNALVDLATPVMPEPVGHADPFAPIPGVSAK